MDVMLGGAFLISCAVIVAMKVYFAIKENKETKEKENKKNV